MKSYNLAEIDNFFWVLLPQEVKCTYSYYFNVFEKPLEKPKFFEKPLETRCWNWAKCGVNFKTSFSEKLLEAH